VRSIGVTRSRICNVCVETFTFRRWKLYFLTCVMWLVFIRLIGVSKNIRIQVTSAGTPVRRRRLNLCIFLTTLYIRTVSRNINWKSAVCCIIKTSKIYYWYKNAGWLVPSKRWYLSNQLYGLTSQRAESQWSKGKADPLQAWSGPEGSTKLRFPDFMTTAQDGGKVVSLTHRPPLPPGNAPGTHFC